MPHKESWPMKKQQQTGVEEVVAWLQKHATTATRDGMARYGLPSDKAFGVPVGVMKKQAKLLGRDHELALGLWETGWYEARMIATFLAEPGEMTPQQMDQWCNDFDNWGICDTACFHLFDRTPHAWKKVSLWAKRREEFVKRAAFALIASLSVHDKEADDEAFMKGLRFIEKAATDERNFVKKGVNWSLRCVGKRNANLHAAAISVAESLATSDDPSAKWIGKDALRDLAKRKPRG
jgi:3-methyladenine DNA glycosylase AlkD